MPLSWENLRITLYAMPLRRKWSLKKILAGALDKEDRYAAAFFTLEGVMESELAAQCAEDHE